MFAMKSASVLDSWITSILRHLQCNIDRRDIVLATRFHASAAGDKKNGYSSCVLSQLRDEETRAYKPANKSMSVAHLAKPIHCMKQ